ncbi:hypothetical protein V3C99_014281 [Haemonchus contortus]
MLPDVELCKKTERRIPLIVVTVLSVANDYKKRLAIRRSWASPMNSKEIKRGRVVVFFILSVPSWDNPRQLKELLEEQYRYRDLIATDLTDSYENLVQKVHACMTFHMQFCPSVPFLLKVDDDVAVHPDRLVASWIWEPGSLRRLYCSVHYNTAPIRDPYNKWYVSKDVWPFKYYPPYCNGPFYVMGNETVKEIAETSLYFAPFVMEDVFYTGLVAGALKTPFVDWNNRIMYLLQSETNDATLCSEDGLPMTVAHYPLESPNDMQEAYQKLMNSKCPPVTKPPDEFVLY